MIEVVPHRKIKYPSGIQAFADSVHYSAHTIGRQEVTVNGAVEAQTRMPVYAYIPRCAEFGVDPWRVLDSIDLYITSDKADIWFESGNCQTIHTTEYNETIRFFVDTKNLIHRHKNLKGDNDHA